MDRDGSHVFTSIGSGRRPTRTTRSWTSNGVNYTLDTTSFSSPGVSFGAMTRSADGPLRSFTAPAAWRSASNGGLLGSAFGLLEDILSAQQPRTEHRASNGRRVQIEPESETDDDLVYDDYDEDARSRHRGIFSRIKDKLLDGRHQPRHERDYSHSREHSQSRERSPARRPRAERRQSSFRTEIREPQWSQTRRRPQSEFIEVDCHDDEDEPMFLGKQPRGASQVDSNMIAALENAVEIERRSVRACKKRLEQATRNPAISSHYLQKLVTELKVHEDALTDAQASLDEARGKQRSTEVPRRNGSRYAWPMQEDRQSQSFEDDFFSPSGPGFIPFFADARTRSRQADPVFVAFENAFDPFSSTGFGLHDQLFEQFRASAAATDDTHFRFFTTGEAPNIARKRARQGMPTTSGPRFQPPPGPSFTPFAPAPAPPHPPPPQPPPAHLLRPAEAKSLFKAYNDRWNALAPTDAAIPYPTRTLGRDALAARDSLWAPACSAPIATWSDETVLQANAQAFYLGVVGLAPRYTASPATGRVEIGFDRGRASAAQARELVDLLKRERHRWHSDRLGRRTGGLAGMNEALQRDERARAVFHAVCELLEKAQAPAPAPAP